MLCDRVLVRRHLESEWRRRPMLLLRAATPLCLNLVIHLAFVQCFDLVDDNGLCGILIFAIKLGNPTGKRDDLVYSTIFRRHPPKTQ
ncbi:unnamed protein product [Brugia timori]|uniref:Uncharacterized protein n=1 Tax=Brugia timori TaxID=42155 RepID=A0A3P7US92_9BILA|nr:unnamed protein product [Brugia timori]